MLTKILFTLLVVCVVYVVYRARGPKSAPRATNEKTHTTSPHLIAYSFVGLLVAISGLIFYLNWRDDHQIVDIRVTNGATGQSTTYQAYKTAIEGRSFQTLDGRLVTLGASDRIEMLVVR